MAGKDRVAIVTGAARGGGRGVALALAAFAWRLVLVGRSTRERPHARLGGTLEDTRDALLALGVEAYCIEADLGRIEACLDVAEKTTRRFGGCDILINNAAYNPVGGLLDTEPRKWAAALAVNVTAAAMLAQALIPGMIARRRGHIVNIGSAAAVSDFFPQSAYAVSKAALERLTTSLADELKNTGISVNCVRVDEAIRSEALMALAPEYARSARGYAPEEFGRGVAWIAEQPPIFSGNILNFADLRRLGALGEPRRTHATD